MIEVLEDGHFWLGVFVTFVVVYLSMTLGYVMGFSRGFNYGFARASCARTSNTGAVRSALSETSLERS